MAFVISDSCISCGSCAGGCPVGAISEGDGKFEIAPDVCISCGACAGTCPVGAISEEQTNVSWRTAVTILPTSYNYETKHMTQDLCLVFCIVKTHESLRKKTFGSP